MIIDLVTIREDRYEARELSSVSFKFDKNGSKSWHFPRPVK